MMADRRLSRGIVWAVVGGAVLLLGIVALVVSSVLTNRAPQTSTASPTPEQTSSSPTPSGEEGTVDPAVVQRGWVAEPITSDPEVYIAAALAAASTFDTTLSSRDDWLSYLDSWFTPDTRYESEADRQRRKAAALLELRQGVVLPEEQWDSLAAEDGRVVAATGGAVALTGVPDDASGDMSIGTADVVLTYTRADGAGVESSYGETVRVSVQVLCGPESVPTPGSAQQAGDCKVVRFFTEPMEP